MPNLIENVNPKRNPYTSLIGVLFLLISAMMLIVQYIVPVFFVLKQEIPYSWWVPFIPLGIGILLIFINDEYFAKIFSRVDKVAGKKTDTE